MKRPSEIGSADVATRLGAVQQRMTDAASVAGRSVTEIELVAVGKGHPSSLAQEAYDSGHRVFGESRGQALAEKAHELPADIDWHFIGPLQTNKVRMVRPNVVLFQAFDRDSLVAPWLKGPQAAPPALLQVNIGVEHQKTGVEPDKVFETFERWEEAGIELRGIMAIPPFGPNAEASRPYFVEMRTICDRIAASLGRKLELSMGMTDDFEVAIEEGSTMIRVGRAIFGPRARVD